MAKKVEKCLKYEIFTSWWLYFGHHYMPFQKTNIYIIKFSYFKHFFNFFSVEYFLLAWFWFLVDYLHAGLYSFLSSFFILKSTLKLRVKCVDDHSLYIFKSSKQYLINIPALHWFSPWIAHTFSASQFSTIRQIKLISNC